MQFVGEVRVVSDAILSWVANTQSECDSVVTVWSHRHTGSHPGRQSDWH